MASRRTFNDGPPGRSRRHQEPATVEGATDHGALTGLSDDDHAQYYLISGTRGLTGALNLGTTDRNLTNGSDTVLKISGISSSVNYIELKADATTKSVGVYARGSDTNIGLDLYPKGAGKVSFGDKTIDDIANWSAKGALVTASAANTPATLTAGSNGQVLVADSAAANGIKWSSTPITRQAVISYVSPAASADYLLDGVPLGATITECYAIVQAATSVVFSIVMRARSAPFTGGTNIVNAQTATTTGGTKTLASTTYTADNVLRLTTGTVTGTPGELLVILKYTMDA